MTKHHDIALYKFSSPVPVVRTPGVLSFGHVFLLQLYVEWGIPICFWGSGISLIWSSRFRKNPIGDLLEWLGRLECIYPFSKIQLVVYYQCCVLIGWSTSRLLCYSSLVTKSAGFLAAKKDFTKTIIPLALSPSRPLSVWSFSNDDGDGSQDV